MRTVLIVSSDVLLLECLVVKATQGLLLVVARHLPRAAHVHDFERGAYGAVFASRTARLRQDWVRKLTRGRLLLLALINLVQVQKQLLLVDLGWRRDGPGRSHLAI